MCLFIGGFIFGKADVRYAAFTQKMWIMSDVWLSVGPVLVNRPTHDCYKALCCIKYHAPRKNCLNAKGTYCGICYFNCPKKIQVVLAVLSDEILFDNMRSLFMVQVKSMKGFKDRRGHLVYLDKRGRKVNLEVSLLQRSLLFSTN